MSNESGVDRRSKKETQQRPPEGKKKEVNMSEAAHRQGEQ